MSPIVEFFTDITSLATVIADLIVVWLVVALFSGSRSALMKFIADYAILIGFVITAGGVLASLFYSQVAGFLPCILCWWQRAFLFPQAIIFGVALWKKDKNILDYSLALSITGAVLALYHTYIQFGGSPLVPCFANAVSCASRFFLKFGYVTIPTMSLTLFSMLIVLSLIARKSVSRNN